MRKNPKLVKWWINRGAFVLAIVFIAVFFQLLVRKHDAFNTRTYDFARFDQAIWNTLHGRFLFSTIKNRSILGDHFSPFLAFLAPLLLIWPDTQVLFLVQAVSLAVAGLFLYQIVRLKHPAIAPWFLLAFYLNPALHDVALFEFRRVTLAVPFLALALYAFYVQKRWLMVLGLGFALLCKENIGLIVFMLGIYLLIFERDWKWGVPIMVVGAGWVVVVSVWVIPIFGSGSDGPPTYPQLYYFSFLGDSYSEIVVNLLNDPLLLVRQVLNPERLRALWRILFPLGIVLPFLALDWTLICLPSVAYMLMSSEPTMYRLEKWYMASVLPVLFAAIAVGLGRLSDRRARWAAVSLLGTTIIGYVFFSPAPMGGRYDPSLYKVTEHHRLASQVVAAVPSDARVATQARYVPHLAHREHVYHYPWIVIGKENIDFFLLDRFSNPYPFQPTDLNYEIDNMVADTSYVVEMEVDGIYLLSNQGDPLPSFPVNRVAEGTIKLDRVEVAIQDERGFFGTAEQEPIELKSGQQVRVSLYWEALALPNAERTVSVRVVDAAGALVAQHDSMPAKGNKPTSWWEAGWKIRDVYYLTIPSQAQSGPGSLNVVLYDTYSLETVPFDGGTEIPSLCSVILVPK